MLLLGSCKYVLIYVACCVDCLQEGHPGKNHFFLDFVSNYVFLQQFFLENASVLAVFQKVQIHFWRSSLEIVTGTSWPRNMLRTFFPEGTQWGCSLSEFHNDVSRGHSAIMQTIQVTICGQFGWMLAAKHKTCNGNNTVHPCFNGAQRKNVLLLDSNMKAEN